MRDTSYCALRKASCKIRVSTSHLKNVILSDSEGSQLPKQETLWSQTPLPRSDMPFLR